MYALLRVIAGVALRWYYRDIQVDGLERIPSRRPLLLVVNHPNALVDALLVGWVVPRRILITAKATLFANPVADRLLRALGVLPLVRTSDEARAGGRLDPQRNRGTFRAVHDALARGGAVLIFPEGKSHDEPSLAPLKTGAARIAMQARETSGSGDGGQPDLLRELSIVPIGLTFERKDAPRSRILVRVGEPLLVREWKPSTSASIEELTAAIDLRLRAVTENYASSDDAARVVHLAGALAALFDAVPAARMTNRRLATETVIAHRLTELASRLPAADPVIRARAEELAARLEVLQRTARAHGVLIEDIGVSLAEQDALRFVIREGWPVLLGGPIALWGRVNHWLPFHAARLVGRRSVESAADPAMRTLVAGVIFVLVSYLVQTLVVAALFGRVVGILYLASLPVAADINFWLSERLRRALRRARAFAFFRRHRTLQRQWARELEQLRMDVIDFEAALSADAPAAERYGSSVAGGGER